MIAGAIIFILILTTPLAEVIEKKIAESSAMAKVNNINLMEGADVSETNCSLGKISLFIFHSGEFRGNF